MLFHVPNWGNPVVVCKTPVHYELFCCYLIVFHGMNLQKRSRLSYVICPGSVGVEFGFKVWKCVCPKIVTPHEHNGVFPKLWLSKLSKLAKKLTTDQNFGGSWTQALGLYVWCSTRWATELSVSTCASNNHQFHAQPCMTGFNKLS